MRTHTVTVTMIRNLDDDMKAVDAKFPGIDTKLALEKMVFDELRTATVLGNLHGTVSHIELSLDKQ